MLKIIEKTVPGFLPGFPLVLGYHRFVAGADGRLLHFMGRDPVADELRAAVPPESFDAYAETWPECKSVCEQMKMRAPAVEVKPADDLTSMIEHAKKALRLPAEGVEQGQ